MAASLLIEAAKPPPAEAPHTPSSSPPPILAVAIFGILTTAILLLSYYLFVTKCRTGRRRRRSPPADQPHGLDPSLIRSIPVVSFTATADDVEQSSQCAVCLNEFQNMERLKRLPGCSHTFHIDCIDTWLQFNPNCPLCRSDVTGAAAADMSAQVISVVEEESRSAGVAADATAEITGQTSTTLTSWKNYDCKTRSMGDECIDIREKEEEFCVHHVRRSFSLDSSSDRQHDLSSIVINSGRS